MKKHLLFLTLAAVLSLLPFGAKAQDTLTVADSTASLSYLPFYSLYADYGTESEFIYPAEMLEAMVGGSITSMSFYKSSSDQTWDETFTVEIEEVSAATYSSAASQSSNPTLVWTGVPSTSNGVWTIELDEPYTYSGENLLIHVKTVGLSSGICPSLSWKGITSTGSGIYRNANSSHVFSSSYTITGYLPKCTFTYEAGSGDICYRPKGLTITNISSDGVDITWVDTLNTSATYDIVAINNDDTMVLATNYTGFSYSVSGLTANTAYTIGVRSVCSAENASSWLSSVCRTSCADISELPYRDGFESYVSGSGNFPVCWYKLKTTYSPSTYPYTYASGVVGSQSLYWYTSTANDTVVICTPSLPIDASSMHVSFWMGSNASTEIGILTDTADLTTFVPMLTVNNENYWRQYDIYTDTIDGMPSTNETFLAFRTVGHAGNTSVDDVLVEPISSCRRPTAGDFSAVTHNSITITWTPDEVTTGTYEVLMSRISQISATDTTAVSTQGIAGNTFTATDLTPNTVYYFWVRSECGSEWYRLGGQATYRSCYPISGLSVDNVNYSSAQISWTYNGNGRGLAESGVHIILRSDSTILREWDVPYTDGSSTFVTGLEASSSYTVEVRTLCDPDTASSASVVAFTTATCGSVSGATAYTTNSYVPFHRFYKYGISQILYPASAVSAITGGITGIAFSSTTDRNYAYTVDVYMGETNQSTLSTSTAIPLNQLTLVASDAQMTSHIGFNNINFTTPYTLSGNGSNIVVMVVNKTGSYDGSGLYWTSHSVGSNVAIYAYTDGSAYNPSSVTYSSTASYRPDVMFLGQCNVDCLAPNLALVSTDINSVSLRWARGAEESAWAVQYTADSVWVSAEDAGDTMVTIDGLAANTSYRFRVGTICDDESIMWSNVIEARTGCEPLAELPFTEGFENMPSGTGTTPACWQVIKTGTSSSDNYYVSTTSPHSGQQCMYFYPYGYHYLVSPVMPAGTDPADLEISFWGKIAAGGSTRIEVGLMTDPTDLNTFRALSLHGSNSATWTEYTVYTDTTTLTVNDEFYVVFRVYSSGGYAAYIDDIGIGTAQCRRPRSLQATSVLDTAVTITWLGMAGATYEYYYGMVDTIPADANILTTDATPLTIEGLMPSSSYNFWVRSVCGENVTAWSSPLAIRTACGVVQMPWSENFDNWSSIDECWARYSGQWMDTGAITLTPATGGWSINSTYGNLPIQGKALTANLWSTNKYWIVSPAIAVEGTIVLSLDIAAEPFSSTFFDNDDRFIVAATTDSGATWTPLYMLGSDPTRDDGALTDLTAAYTTVNVPISGFDGDTVQIGFYEASISSGGDSRILIDNLSLGLADCLRPSSIREIVDAESATITWRDFSTNNTSGYEFIFSPTNNMNDSAAVSQILGVGDTSVTFTGLTPQTTYYYFLRSTCEDTPTANSWVRGSIRTLCLIETLPFVYDFEGIPSGSGTEPECWIFDQQSTSSSSNHYVTNSSHHGGSQSMYFYPYGHQYLISSAMPAGTNPTELEISFWASVSSSGSSRLDVGLMTDPTDLTTFSSLFSTTGSGTWQEYSVYTDTTSVDADVFYVAFRIYCSNGYANYLDDITIANAGCRRPASINVDANSITPDAARVNWSDVNGVDTYRLRYGTSDTLALADSIDVSANGYTLTDLQINTRYYAWIQSLCADGSISDPRGPVIFTTERACYPVLNLTQTGSTGTSAAFMWDNDERGYEATGALVVLRDNTDSTSTDTMASDGVNYHFFTDLDRTHSYTVTILTQCDADTATAVSTAIVFDPCASVTGTGSSSHSPVYGLYNYGITQVLYPRTTVSNMSEINGLQWYVSTIPSSHPVRTVDVYMGVTDSAALTVATALPASALTKVVTNGQLNVGQTGWTSLAFDSIWTIPDSGSNIVVAVVNKTGSWSSIGWRGHEGNGIYGYQDDALSNYFDISSYSNTGVDNTVADINFLGDCEFDETACAAPVAVVTDVDSVNATIIWMGNTDAYTVQYRKLSDYEWSEAEGTTSPATLDELMPGTGYAVRVGALCADGDTLWSSTLGFTTMCALMHLPLDFAQAEIQAAYTYGISPCFDWQSFSLSSSYVSTSSNNAWFALPAIAEPLNGAQLRTSVAATSSSSTSMRVGVMEADGSITWVDTVALPHASSSSDVTEQVVYLDSYTGTGNRVVIGSMSSNYMYFREIHVENLDACRRVENVQVSNITESGATVTWTPGEGQTQWLVYVNGQEVATATTTTYDITGINASWEYTVAIRAFCGGADTARAVSASFSTPCASLTLPWSENFDGWTAFGECWSRYSGAFPTTGSTTTSGWNRQTSYGNIEIDSVAIAMNVYSTYKYWAVSPAINVTADQLTLTFDIAGETWSSTASTFDDDDVFIVAVSTDNSTWTTVYELSAETTADGLLTDLTSTYDTRTVAINGYNGQTIYIAFYGASGATGGDNRLVIDNISLVAGSGPGPQPQNCDAPVVTSAIADGNTITLSWTGAAAQYQVASTQGAWTNPNPEAVVNATTYTFENLSAGSYTVGVRAVCEDGGFSAWATRSVTVSGGEGIDDVDGLVLALFPNPAAEQVTLQLGEASEVSLVDQSGRTAGRYSLDAGTSVLDLSQYASGVYYVRVVSTSGTSVRKLVVK